MTGEGLTGIDQGILLAESMLDDRRVADGQDKNAVLRETLSKLANDSIGQRSFLKTLFQSLGKEGDTKITDRRDAALGILTDTTKDGSVRIRKAIASIVEDNLIVVCEVYITAVKQQTKDNDPFSGSIFALLEAGKAIAPLIRPDEQTRGAIIRAWERVARRFSKDDNLPYINLGIKNIEYVIYSDPRVEPLIEQEFTTAEIAKKLGITEWEVTQSARHFNAALKAERAVGGKHAAKMLLAVTPPPIRHSAIEHQGYLRELGKPKRGRRSKPKEKLVISEVKVQVGERTENKPTDIEASIEDKKKELLGSQFAQGSIEEISNLLDKIVEEALRQSPSMGIYELFKTVGKDLPEEIPTQIQKEFLQVADSMYTNTKKLREKALLFLNAKTILSAVDFHFAEGVDTEEDKEEMMSCAITSTLELFNINPNIPPIHQQIRRAAVDGIVKYIAQRDNMPMGWTRNAINKRLIATSIKEKLVDADGRLGDDDTRALAEELSKETGINKESLLFYIQYVELLNNSREITDLNEDSTFTEAVKNELTEYMQEVLATLNENQRNILKLLYFEGKTISEIARERNVSVWAIGQARDIALNKLRNQGRTSRLSDYKATGEGVIFPAVLTDRQKEVLTLIAHGFSTEQIGQNLSLDLTTINGHKARINNILGTNNIEQSVIKAVNMGTLDVSELTKDLNKQTIENLSTLELIVLENLANGKTHQEIGQLPNLHYEAVHKALISVRKKLGLNTLQSTLLYISAKKEGILPPKELSSLSNKEKEVFKLIIEGYSRQQISEIEKLGIKAFDNQRRQIFEFFGVSTLTELLIKLVDMKIIDPNKYIENVKKQNSDFLQNVDTANISSLLPKIEKTEMDVLDAFVTSSKGGTSKDIADTLNIRTTTISRHFNSISKKLGGAGREHMAMWYLAAKPNINSLQENL